MKRVLLTGARGFIGRHCIDPLRERGFEIHAISRSPQSRATSPALVWHTADLLDPQQVRTLFDRVEPSHVLHAAWNTEHGSFWNATDNAIWVRASLIISEEFARAEGRRMVTVGTCAEYDWTADRLTEDHTPLTPSTYYGACKHALHEVQAGHLRRSGISFGWARVFFPYGPHESPDRLVSSVARSLLLGEPALCSSGEQLRDFIYVKDSARALVELLDSDVEAAVNIGSGQPLMVRDMAMEIARQLGREDLLRIGALAQREGDPAAIVADTRRLQQRVGFQPRYDPESGIAETIEYWRETMDIPS